MFLSVGSNESSNLFKFYGGTTNVARINGVGDIWANGAISSASSSTTGNATIGGNLTVTGTLNTTSFYSIKPYVAAYVILSAVSTTVKPGFVTPTLAKTAGQYIFTLPTAHPSGVNYTVFVQQRMSAQTSSQALYGVLVNSSTSFTVWSKTTANVAVDSDFYVHTVP